MEDQLQRWKMHFESVFNSLAPSQLPDLRPVDVPMNINTGSISKGEIRTALTQLAVWRILCHHGIPNKIINVLKVQYQGFTCHVLHGGTMTEPGEVKTGVGQRCLL